MLTLTYIMAIAFSEGTRDFAVRDSPICGGAF